MNEGLESLWAGLRWMAVISQLRFDVWSLPRQIHGAALNLCRLRSHAHHLVTLRPGMSQQLQLHAQFEEAWRKHGAAPPDDAEPGRSSLRLINSPQSD
jgi:hypothetical protein